VDYPDCAIVYTADAPAYVEEALQSLGSARRHLPEVVAYLQAPEALLASDLAAPFDQRVPMTWTGNPFFAKHRMLDGVAEQRVLFLDGDTTVCGGLRDAFDLLGRFDLLAAHAPCRGDLAMPNFNTGVIFAHNTDRGRAALDRWPSHADAAVDGHHDQPAFARMVRQESVSVYVLPPEFNARLIFPFFVCGPVRIFHARVADPEAAEATLNAQAGVPRAFTPGDFGLPDLYST
jgi:hypothetical protein